MSGRWKSSTKRPRPPHAASTMIVLLLAGNASASHKLIIDAGHGGTDPGTGCNEVCCEDEMNFDVALVFYNLIVPEADFAAQLTRWSDWNPSYDYRINLITEENAEAYISVHHNCCNANYSLALYCDAEQQALNGRWYDSRTFGEILENELYTDWLYPDFGGESRDVHEEFAWCTPNCSMHKYIKSSPVGPTVFGEGAFVRSAAGVALCSDYNVVTDEANQYANAVVAYYNLTPIGTNFWVEDWGTYLKVRWQDSDGSASITYDIYSGDSCLGPFSFIHREYGQNGVHDYAYPDTGVQFARNYYYYIHVSTGEKTQVETAVPSGKPAPSPPGSPTGIVAAGSFEGGHGTVDLTWSAGSGATDGYRVYRRVLSSDFAGCVEEIVYRGQTTTTAFTDDGVPPQVDVYYRIDAFNATGPAGLSPPVQAFISVTDAPESNTAVLELALRAHSAPGAVVRFDMDVPAATVASLDLFDVGGRKVTGIFRKELSAGQHTALWHGESANERVVSSGVYFARLWTETDYRTAKVAILR